MASHCVDNEKPGDRNPKRSLPSEWVVPTKFKLRKMLKECDGEGDGSVDKSPGTEGTQNRKIYLDKAVITTIARLKSMMTGDDIDTAAQKEVPDTDNILDPNFVWLNVKEKKDTLSRVHKEMYEEDPSLNSSDSGSIDSHMDKDATAAANNTDDLLKTEAILSESSMSIGPSDTSSHSTMTSSDSLNSDELMLVNTGTPDEIFADESE